MLPLHRGAQRVLQQASACFLLSPGLALKLLLSPCLPVPRVSSLFIYTSRGVWDPVFRHLTIKKVTFQDSEEQGIRLLGCLRGYISSLTAWYEAFFFFFETELLSWACE